MNHNQSDPVIDEVRAIRERMSEQFDHDPDKLVAYLMELQKQLPNRIIEPVGTNPSGTPRAKAG